MMALRGAQLVRHVGEELRLVPAGRLELGALVRDLPEEPGVLDGQGGLGGEGLQDIHDLWRRLAGRLAIEGQAADDLVLAEQGHRELRVVVEAAEGVPEATIVSIWLGDSSDL